MSDVTDDEGREDEEQRHHGEGCGGPHHLCGGERAQSYTELMSCVLKLLGEVRDSVSGDKIISIS